MKLDLGKEIPVKDLSFTHKTYEYVVGIDFIPDSPIQSLFPFVPQKTIYQIFQGGADGP